MTTQIFQDARPTITAAPQGRECVSLQVRGRAPAGFSVEARYHNPNVPILEQPGWEQVFYIGNDADLDQYITRATNARALRFQCSVDPGWPVPALPKITIVWK